MEPKENNVDGVTEEMGKLNRVSFASFIFQIFLRFCFNPPLISILRPFRFILFPSDNRRSIQAKRAQVKTLICR